jgi:predicted nuclease of predicted toxin-antitoxin system
MATSSCPRTEFHQRSFLLGHPPKVVWIRRGNCSTRDIETLLRDRLPDLLTFDADPGASFLALS